MKFVSALLIILLAQLSFSQNHFLKKQKLDSLRAQLTADSVHTFRFKKIRPYGNIDNRNSFNKPSNFTGYQLGVIVNEYHTFGLGLYYLNSAPNASIATLRRGYRLSRLGYSTVFYEYLLYNKKHFEIDLPFEIGYGEYRARIVDTLNTKYNEGFVRSYLPLSAGVKFIARPIRWIGFSVMVGYRHFFEKKQVLDFNGFYFPLGVWVDLRQVYRDIKYYAFQKKRYKREVKKVF